MSQHPDNMDETHLQPVDHLDAVCRDFEERCCAGERPRIDELLIAAAPEDRERLFERLIIIEASHDRASGRPSSIAEYASRYPEYLPIVEQVLDSYSKSADSAQKSLDSTFDRIISPTPEPLADGRALEWSTGVFVDRYRLTSLLGRGGFGEVWRAYDTELDVHVAIKLPRRERVNDPNLNSFMAEARKAAAMKHPGFVTIHNVGTTHGVPFIVSELIEGQTLQQLMRIQRFTPREAANVIAKIARALHVAHTAGFVHRDMKPGNVMIRPDESIVIMDFGLATSENEQLRESNSIVGTFAYMSPEQARGESRHVDCRTDIYSLGVMLYELLTGRLPYVADKRSALLEQIISREVRPLRSIIDSLDPKLEFICHKCLNKRISERYSVATDLADELEALISNQSQTPSIKTKHGKILTSLVTLAALMLLITIWGVFFDDSRQKNIKENRLGGNIEIHEHVENNRKPAMNNALIPGTPAEIKAYTVTTQDGWFPLLKHKHHILAWMPHADTDFVTIDSETETLTSACPKSTWISQSQITHHGPFSVRLVADLANWQGQVGIVWGLHQDMESFPAIKYVCYGAVIERFQISKPLQFTVNRIEIINRLPQRLGLGVVTPLSTVDIGNLDGNCSLEFNIRDTGCFLRSSSSIEEVEAEIESAELHRMLVLQGAIGLIGRGRFVTIRMASFLVGKE